MKLFHPLSLVMLVVLSACSDSPTLPVLERTPPGGAGPRQQVLEEVIVIGTPVCDPYQQLDGSCDGGGACLTSMESGTGGFDGVSACGTGGGGAGTADPGTGAGGGGSGSTSPGTTTQPSVDGTGAFKEGPLLWGACVLAVINSVYSIDKVAGKFEDWWTAQRAYQLAYANWKHLLQNPERQLYDGQLYDLEFRMDIAEMRRDDAAGAVSEMTGDSLFSLLAAGVACGAAALLPTP
jgi:hypothetical protein